MQSFLPLTPPNEKPPPFFFLAATFFLPSALVLASPLVLPPSLVFLPRPFSAIFVTKNPFSRIFDCASCSELASMVSFTSRPVLSIASY